MLAEEASSLNMEEESGELGDTSDMSEAAIPEPDATEDTVETAVEVAPEQPEPVKPAVVAPTPAEQARPPAAEGGVMSYLFYALGAALVAILAFVFFRRRGEDDEPVAETTLAAPAEDVVADVKLKEQPLQVETPVEEPEPEEEAISESEELAKSNRGYGERKHDE